MAKYQMSCGYNRKRHPKSRMAFRQKRLAPCWCCYYIYCEEEFLCRYQLMLMQLNLSGFRVSLLACPCSVTNQKRRFACE